MPNGFEPGDDAGEVVVPDADVAATGEEDSRTLYGLAMQAINDYIQIYLALTQQTKAFTDVQLDHVQSFDQKLVILAGIGSPLDPAVVSAADAVNEWQRVRAIAFDAESAITPGVYIQLRGRVEGLLAGLERATEGFTQFDPAYISRHPYMLPILQRVAGITSKAELKRQIGSVSDNAVSGKAAEKLSAILNRRQLGRAINRAQILQSVEPTLEGIVRDLVGRVLLESIVAKALDDAHVPYKRESQYSRLQGVVYDFRADFVIPDDVSPQVFIEVRKSSSRHASLYAKDKMFSAINWKGRNKNLLAVLIAEGPWTAQTKLAMSKVFDYVMPLNLAPTVVADIAAYINGDRTKLRWLIDFTINNA